MKKIFLLLATAVLASACSSIVEGTTQNVTVTTDPSGANCELSSPEGVVAVASPTPTSVTLDKSKYDLTVDCTLEDHQPAAATLPSSLEAMTFGNILFGGIVGVGIDAASGALNKYPDSINLVLFPDSFESAEARDVFFDRQIARTEADAATAVSEVNRTCNTTQQDCDALLVAVEEERTSKIAELEAQRLAAIIE